MSIPIFSVIVPTFNRPNILIKTLYCLESQKVQFGYEVIVVDDCSTVPLPDLGLGKGIRTTWKLLRNDKNLGRAATRNRGIREAAGEYILMIDDDIWAEPSLVEAHYQKQIEIGGGVVVGAVPPSREIENSTWNGYVMKRYERIHRRLNSEVLSYGLFLTGNVSLPAAVLKESRGFNEDFKDYSFEDTELGFRLQQAGVKFCYAPDAVGSHYFNEDLESICSKAFQMGRSSYIFIRVHPERGRDIQYHSLILGLWRGIDIFKNIAKIFICNQMAYYLIKRIIQFTAELKINFLVQALLPWLELQEGAKGVRSALYANRN